MRFTDGNRREEILALVFVKRLSIRVPQPRKSFLENDATDFQRKELVKVVSGLHQRIILDAYQYSVISKGAVQM